MARIGYARVSTDDQHPESQAAALTAAGCERVFTDTGVSGKLASRPQLDACLAYLRDGDALVITKLDRLGRSVRHLTTLLADLGQRRVDLVVTTQGIDTTTPAGKLLFHMLAAVAEFERDLIAERTREGLAGARARGRHGGRPAKLTPGQVTTARQLRGAGTHSLRDLAALFSVGKSTVARALDQDQLT